jgi:hypothetical protein
MVGDAPLPKEAAMQKLLVTVETSLSLIVSLLLTPIFLRYGDEKTIIIATITMGMCLYLCSYACPRFSTVLTPMRRITVIVFARCLVALVYQPSYPGGETLATLTILLISLDCASFLQFAYTNHEIQEVNRIIFSIKWIFADTIGAVLRTSSMGWLVLSSGAVVILACSGHPRFFAHDDVQDFHHTHHTETRERGLVFVQAVLMGWTDLLLYMVLSGNGAVEPTVLNRVTSALLVGFAVQALQRGFSTGRAQIQVGPKKPQPYNSKPVKKTDFWCDFGSRAISSGR